MKTIVIHPDLKSHHQPDARTLESKLEEANGLAMAINLEIALSQIVHLQSITPASYIGKGKVDELAVFIEENGVELAIINEHITPVQQRNLEKIWNCKVIDRTALIIEIFGARANTKEGSLQVELAALEYQKSRLVRSWTHLERQRGGGGFIGGPGETQIESDRRAIKDKISMLKKQLKKVVQTRELHRESRRKVPYPIVALVGYTNAGKSTLFNKITGAHVLAEDKLFATLDPTMRLIKLPSGRKAILSDTVGFISDLPTDLVAAFRATLEEVVEADIILHVRDVSNHDREAHKQDVLSILAYLGIKPDTGNNMLEVLNKIDLLDDPLNDEESLSTPVSAITGQGIDKLLLLIDEKLDADNKRMELDVDAGNGKVIAWIYAHATVHEQHEDNGRIYFNISISDKDIGRLKKMMGE